MKKLMMILLMVTMMPFFGSSWTSSICSADDEKYSGLNPNTPGGTLINSYYDYSDGILYVYSNNFQTVANMTVTHDGQTVLSDIVFPGDDTVMYIFNGYPEGYYDVTFTIGTDVLTSFRFLIF